MRLPSRITSVLMRMGSSIPFNWGAKEAKSDGVIVLPDMRTLNGIFASSEPRFLREEYSRCKSSRRMSLWGS